MMALVKLVLRRPLSVAVMALLMLVMGVLSFSKQLMSTRVTTSRRDRSSRSSSHLKPTSRFPMPGLTIGSRR